jgi:acyl carrier protein
MTTENEIFERLKPLVAEVLGVAPETIQPNSVLVTDLGAESIDLLDLSFRIEETFNVRIEADEIEREASRRLAGAVYDREGRFTEQALAEIRKALPELDAARLSTGLRKTDLPSLLTVRFFAGLIARKQSATPGVPNA